MNRESPHFKSFKTWQEAQPWLTFRPLVPQFTAGCALESVCVYVMDHKRRGLAAEDRSLEAHYGAFAFTQSFRPPGEARRLALEVTYGSNPQQALIIGREARAYELGPEPPPGDIDGRSPSVVTWYDAMHDGKCSSSLAVRFCHAMNCSR